MVRLCILAVLAVVSLSLLDDYGVSTDEGTQRRLGRLSVDYALGISDTLLTFKDGSHGTAFEARCMSPSARSGCRIRATSISFGIF